ncbi:hypothetical protein [Burkholderia glumae]|uniref:hypothetical protein n=1 Tax=Burkholderia glumae TaxID=337 RepID=UPI0021502AF0|nr:hypothetical protein [Burkholderia glumae]
MLVAYYNRKLELKKVELMHVHEQAKIVEQRAHDALMLAEQRAPARLEIAQLLEAFAREAAGHFDRCVGEVADLLADQKGQARGAREVQAWPELTFDLSPVEDWSVLPIRTVSQCKELPLAVVSSSDWIHAGYDEDWLSGVEAYELDAQRGIFYGLIAAELAHEIRLTLDAPPSALVTDCFDRLTREFTKLKQRYADSQGKACYFIPDLRARLEREIPNVARAVPILLQAQG